MHGAKNKIKTLQSAGTNVFNYACHNEGTPAFKITPALICVNLRYTRSQDGHILTEFMALST